MVLGFVDFVEVFGMLGTIGIFGFVEIFDVA